MNEFEARWTAISDSGHAAGCYRVYPDHPLDFYVQYSLAGLRELVVELTATDLPTFDLPAFRNIDVVKVPILGGVRIGMTLQDSDLSKSFSVMCYDLAERSRLADTTVSAAGILLNALENWSELFRKLPNEGLTREQVLGLIGELLVLEALLADANLAPGVLIHGWGGPDREARDIGVNGTRIEVKAQRSTTSTKLRISSLHQLDERGDRVFVVLIRLTPSEQGRSLVDLVQHLQTLLSATPLAALEFQRKLALAGMTAEAGFSQEPYSEDQRLVYRVTQTFPRLVLGNVPEGVTAAQYEISGPALDSCRVTWADITEAIHG
jgi:hypothetical protein